MQSNSFLSNQATQGNSSLDERIIIILREFSAPPHLSGYKYVQSAIKIAYGDVSILGRVCKSLYPAVAELHDTTSSRVERSIRTFIGAICNKKDNFVMPPRFCGYMENLKRAKMEPREFIALIVDELFLVERREIKC